LRGQKTEYSDIQVKNEYPIDKLLDNNAGMYELNINIENVSAEVIGFKLFNAIGEYIEVFISLSEQKLFMDRKNSGTIDFSEHFPAVTFAPVDKKQFYQLRLLVDRASVECFEGVGETAMTNLIFPNETYNRMVFYAKGGEYALNKFEIYPLK
jgi:fructan beta-fructosidase